MKATRSERIAWSVILSLVLAAAVAGAQAPPAEAAGGWQTELDEIADLLIDGRMVEAKAAAQELLARQGLPERVEARAQRLLAKAEERIPPGHSPSAPSDPPPFPAASFDVRVARPGVGFAAGEVGSLAVDETGVSFYPEGQERPAWGVVWERVLGLEADGGLWDTRYPLELRQRRGPSRYLALTDAKENFPPPDRLLAAFERAQREARAREAARAEDAAGGSPEKEQER